MDNTIEAVMKSYLGLIGASLKISEIISEHDNEEELSSDSLITGLVYRLMVPMTDDELTEYMETAGEIMDDINISAEGSSEEEEISDYIVSNTSRNIKSPKCNCDICHKARLCLINYQGHEPKDRLAQIFKDSINKSCMKYKIII